MCLRVSIERTNEVLNSLGDGEQEFTFYKTFYITTQGIFKKDLLALYRYYSFKKGYGTFVEKGVKLPLANGVGIYEGAFHGRIRKERGAVYLTAASEGAVVTMGIKVKKEDFIAAGVEGDVCFKAFTISKEEWKKASRSCISVKKYAKTKFSPDIAKKILKNKVLGNLTTKDLLPSEFLNTFLSWSRTKEGDSFWRQIHRDLHSRGM
jgi:hypothetical protein